MKNLFSSSQKSFFQTSANILKVIYLSGFFILIVTLGYYQIFKGDYYSKRAEKNYVRLMPIRAVRGSIFDRNGKTLAYDRAIFNISVIPYQIKDSKDALFSQISKYLDYDLALLNKNYKRNLQNYFSPVDIIRDIDKTIALNLKEKFGDLLLINPQPQRYYPYPYQLAHVLGYVKDASSFYEKLKKYGYSPLERVGFLGIEQYYDTYLKGEDGGDLVEVDAKGRAVGFLGKRIPKKGKDIYLTIDKDFQIAAKDAIGKKRGCIILMNAKTGEMLALYSSPSFDPNLLTAGKNTSKFLSSKHSPLLNRTIQSRYPIGSIFKPFLSLVSLEEGKSTPYTPFNCEGQLELGISRFRCLKHHGQENLFQAIAHSCNVYFYNLGLRSGPTLIHKWSEKFGLASLTKIDLPYERKGFVPSIAWKKNHLKQNWYAGDTLNLSIGQGYLGLTPLEVIRAFNLFANKGDLVTPHILKQISNLPSGLQKSINSGVNKENVLIIKKALRQVVISDTGTGRTLNSLGLGIAGKTGTAQTSGKSHGWFLGFFPDKEPQYTICVFLENGGSSYNALKVTGSFLSILKEEDLL